MPTRVLLIDDDGALRALLARFLERSGFAVLDAPSGASGLHILSSAPVDLVVLDLMMPGEDGFEVFETLRRSSDVPVLFLTARGGIDDRLRGLELGADDFLTKPCDPRELALRIENIVRRTGHDPDSALRTHGLALERASRTARTEDGTTLELTSLEFDLLYALVAERGRTVSRDALRRLAGRGDTMVSEHAMAVHVSNLRAKLGEHAARLVTVRGVGYTWTT